MYVRRKVSAVRCNKMTPAHLQDFRDERRPCALARSKNHSLTVHFLNAHISNAPRSRSVLKYRKIATRNSGPTLAGGFALESRGQQSFRGLNSLFARTILRSCARPSGGKLSRHYVATLLLWINTSLFASAIVHAQGIDSPTWTKDLVIYEVATKAFTSPHGPESGTFASLQEKLAYLQDLGITAIWLTGYSRSDPHHFYNIWTQYAVLEPGEIERSLGTSLEFATLIHAAHDHGIKVFLDVITHGLMPESRVVKEHPQWFRGGSWGMVDFDWDGGHIDLDDWWVALWSRYVTEYGIDGFRLDVNIYRPDLWARVRQNAVAARHPIVVFEEGNDPIPGVTDFMQVDNAISNTVTGELDQRMLTDIPAFYAQRFGRGGASYRVKIQFVDGSVLQGQTDGTGDLHVHSRGLTIDRVSRRFDSRSAGDGIPDLELKVDEVPARKINDIEVTELSPRGAIPQRWKLGRTNERAVAVGDDALVLSSGARALTLYVPLLSYGSSVQLSCHDNGWTGYPAGKTPYAARGSRATFGYAFLFTPMIPIFMGGEEFDATFHALPELSPDLYGGARPGQGKWLYGSMLDWSELREPSHREMLDDVKWMLTLRRKEAALLTPQIRGDAEPPLAAVGYRSDVDVPIPYVRWNADSAVIVMANRHTNADAHLTLDVPLNRLAGHGTRYRVTDLWNGGPPKIKGARELSKLAYTVKRDRVRRGGIGLLKIERLH